MPPSSLPPLHFIPNLQATSSGLLHGSNSSLWWTGKMSQSYIHSPIPSISYAFFALLVSSWVENQSGSILSMSAVSFLSGLETRQTLLAHRWNGIAWKLSPTINTFLACYRVLFTSFLTSRKLQIIRVIILKSRIRPKL